MIRKINKPAWVNGRTIYEVNIRQYTKSGTFREFESHLPRLKELGVGILWFMPIQPIGVKNRKGNLGSYYSVSNYNAVNPEFGTMEEFKKLVEKIHSIGMKVIIDWVANHTAWDHHWTFDHPGYYTKDDHENFKAPFPEWEDVIHLDYGNPDLWDDMIKSMAFWLKETNIDGFRCDMAHLVPTLFWNRARRDLDRIKPVYMLAESENHDLLEYAFDTIYNWKLLHAFNDIAQRKIDAIDLSDILIKELKYLPEGAGFLNFTSNHDENSWQGSAIERLHYYLEPITVLSFIIKGNTLIYSGQEAGNYRSLKFFDKDEIEWKEDKMFGLYQKLIRLKRTYPDLLNGDLSPIKNDKGDKVLSFIISREKQKVLSFMNFTEESLIFHIKCGNFDGEYIDIVSNENIELNCHNPIEIKPFSSQVLIKK